MDCSNILYFLGASVLLTVAPGPDNIFVVTQGISKGRKAAIITATGMCSGIIIHTTAAALGISVIFYSSALAFNLVKFAGAAYLLFLAYRAVREQKNLTLRQNGSTLTGFALFRRGFIMNVLNPKVALFFLAFLPQFVSPDTRNFAMEMILLGGLFMLQGIVIFTMIGYFSGSIGEYIQKNTGMSGIFSWLTAGVFALLGIRLAFSQQ